MRSRAIRPMRSTSKACSTSCFRRLRKRPERTYSAPLATHAYTKEAIELPAGGGMPARQVRDYPRLKYGGAQLRDPERDWKSDVLLTAFRGAALALPLWLFASLALVGLLQRPPSASARAHSGASCGAEKPSCRGARC